MDENKEVYTFVIDCSGSMASEEGESTRIDLVKKKIYNIIDEASENVEIALVTFQGDSVKVYQKEGNPIEINVLNEESRNTKLDGKNIFFNPKTNEKTLTSIIKSLEPDNMTPGGIAFETAVSLTLSFYDTEKLKGIIDKLSNTEYDLIKSKIESNYNVKIKGKDDLDKLSLIYKLNPEINDVKKTIVYFTDGLPNVGPGSLSEDKIDRKVWEDNYKRLKQYRNIQLKWYLIDVPQQVIFIDFDADLPITSSINASNEYFSIEQENTKIYVEDYSSEETEISTFKKFIEDLGKKYDFPQEVEYLNPPRHFINEF